MNGFPVKQVGGNLHACFYGEDGSNTDDQVEGSVVLGLEDLLDKFPYEIVPFEITKHPEVEQLLSYLDTSPPPTTFEAPRTNHPSA